MTSALAENVRTSGESQKLKHTFCASQIELDSFITSCTMIQSNIFLCFLVLRTCIYIRHRYFFNLKNVPHSFQHVKTKKAYK